MPQYKSRFISLSDDTQFHRPATTGPFQHDPAHIAAVLRDRGIEVASSATISGVPRICFTQVQDAVGYAAYKELSDQECRAFHGAIQIHDGAFLESDIERPPFHSACVKLTSVKANDRPAGRITIGKGVQMVGTAIVAYDHVEIGDYAGFGPMVTIMDSDGHPIDGRGTDTEIARLTAVPVKIGANSWIGAGAWIMKGVEIGENCVVGANSVVVKSVPAGSVVMGNPARRVSRV